MSALEHGLREMVHAIVREEIRLAMAEQAPDENLSTREAADYAKVAQGTIRRWIRDGRLPPLSAGRELRVRRRDLDRLMTRGRAGVDSVDEIADRIARKRLKR